jgi:hypothetical protein
MKPEIRLLKWIKHGECRDGSHNGWHGQTVHGESVCYIYQPFDNRIKRGSMPWQGHCYYGPQENPLKGRARFDRFTTARAAKLAAQRWWKRQVEEMIESSES